MKKNILIFVLGFICATAIGVGATILYKAEDIKFTPSDSSWEVTNVEDAINYLQSNKELKIVSAGTATSGSTISVTKGNILVAVSIATSTSTTNLEVIDNWRRGPASPQGINSYSVFYRILDDKVSITIGSGYNYVYYELG